MILCLKYVIYLVVTKKFRLEQFISVLYIGLFSPQRYSHVRSAKLSTASFAPRRPKYYIQAFSPHTLSNNESQIKNVA